ncbi:MAG TPA: METTL5 family protein [Methanomassiliicoccales archaeon]|jgi:putative methylase
MKKKDLEILLQSIPPFDRPKASLEQYSTPSVIAADFLFTAYADGDIADKAVADLGCGTGILAIGAGKLGAKRVIGVDLDENAITQAKANAKFIGVDVDFLNLNVIDFDEKVDTVVMNPPFGSQKRNADRPFLDTAMTVADTVYSIHMTDTVDFLAKYISDRGFYVDYQKRYKFEIPHMFSFHTKAKKCFDVSLLCLRRIG